MIKDINSNMIISNPPNLTFDEQISTCLEKRHYTMMLIWIPKIQYCIIVMSIKDCYVFFLVMFNFNWPAPRRVYSQSCWPLKNNSAVCAESKSCRQSYIMSDQPSPVLHRSTFCSVMAQLTEETQPSFETTLKSKAVSENCNVKFSCVVTGKHYARYLLTLLKTLCKALLYIYVVHNNILYLIKQNQSN